jgi:hypothetical protein
LGVFLSLSSSQAYFLQQRAISNLYKKITPENNNLTQKRKKKVKLAVTGLKNTSEISQGASG